MSKFDYQKELKEALMDAGLLTLGIYGLAWVGAKLGMPKPTLAPNFENIVKVFGYLTLADMAKDYAKNQKWIPT